MIDGLYVRGDDGVIRSLDEHYDTQKDVEQDPYGAWLAIQNLWVDRETKIARIAELEDKLGKAQGIPYEVTAAARILKGEQNDD